MPKIELQREGKHVVNIDFLNRLGKVVRSTTPQIVELKKGETKQLRISALLESNRDIKKLLVP